MGAKKLVSKASCNLAFDLARRTRKSGKLQAIGQQSVYAHLYQNIKRIRVQGELPRKTVLIPESSFTSTTDNEEDSFHEESALFYKGKAYTFEGRAASENAMDESDEDDSAWEKYYMKGEYILLENKP